MRLKLGERLRSPQVRRPRAATRNDRLTPIRDVPSAQIAAARRRLGERASSTPLLRFEISPMNEEDAQ